MTQRTTLYEKHRESGGKMVDFAGWSMPIHYGSQLQEHHTVRRDAGMFDVSHMVVLDLQGDDATAFLQTLLANDVAKLSKQGKALYSCMLNHQGKIIDDLIVYRLQENTYRIVVNAATREKDLAWMNAQLADFSAELTIRDDLAMIAIQGPQAREKAIACLADKVSEVAAQAANELAIFYGTPCDDYFIARTGYTGEDGFEIMLPNNQAPAFWDALLQAGVKPCGLGARDTLRLEAGMNLYGTDMDETTSPLVSGLTWTIAWTPENRAFNGRTALTAEKQQGVQEKFVGLILQGKGVLRSQMKVVCSQGEGITTSGTFSPTLKQAIALARIPLACEDQCHVEIRGKLVAATIVKPSFVRHGKAVN
ncbi:MAG TPA: glycine cleavage system aminomethyltransferase GcvT [Thiothrix sp.]|nr:glycine cleavage system aminomethyltransferase GcvT [Thiothrix sp.]